MEVDTLKGDGENIQIKSNSDEEEEEINVNTRNFINKSIYSPLSSNFITLEPISRPLPSLNLPIVSFRDINIFALFLLHIIITIIISTTSTLNNYKNEINIPNNKINIISPILNINILSLSFLPIMIVLTLFYSILWIILCYTYQLDKKFIYFTWIISFLGLLPLGIMMLLSFTLFGYIMGFFLIIIFISDTLWMIRKKNHFEFFNVLLDLVIRFLQSNKALIYVLLCIIINYFIWLIHCIHIINQFAFMNQYKIINFKLLFMYFHFYWTSQVFRNIITFVVSGTVMYWYHHSFKMIKTERTTTTNNDNQVKSYDMKVEKNEEINQPSDLRITLHYLRCSLTNSFGSICLGSFVCPIAHLLWNYVRWKKRSSKKYMNLNTNQSKIIKDNKINQFIRTFHKYTFAYVAAYGKSFQIAARDAWELINEKGIEAIIDDDISSRLILFSINGFVGFMTLLFGLHLYNIQDTNGWLFINSLLFIIGYTTASITTQLVGSIIKTLYVCFAENPYILSQLHPTIYHRLLRLSEYRTFQEDRGETI